MTSKISARLFIIIFLVCIVSCEIEEKIQVQDWTEYTDYIPLPEEKVKWINEVTSEEIPDMGPVPYLLRTVTNRYYINGDTSINTLSYKKVYNNRRISTRDLRDDSETNDSITVYSGGLRQNIADKKVFFLFASDDSEILLFDFDVEMGDSVQYYTTREEKGIISCIDSVLIGNRYHKEYYVQVGGFLNAFYYIEGIGGSEGLIIEPDGSLNGPWNIFVFECIYDDEKIDIDWDINPEGCFE